MNVSLSPPPATEITNEAVALGTLVTWSNSQPLWQRDALRRLCDKEILDDADFADLLAFCTGKSVGALPLDASHVSDPGAAGATVVLKAIRDVRHVNALAEDQVLSFGKKGLTVIYGDNGSGKSGYARILKQACRARGARNEKIHPNIYGSTCGPATASIEFLAGQQNCNDPWQHGKAADGLLSSVSIFDSNAANVHVETANDLAYTPFPLKLLSSLAQACQVIKVRLSEEIQAIEKQTPSSLKEPPVKPETAVGKLLAGLSAGTDIEAVEKLATLTVAETAWLAELRADLAADPAKQARQLQQLGARLDAYISRLETLSAAITDETLEKLGAARSAFEAAAAASHASSNALFAGDPLPKIGSATWQVLWEAARNYSEKAAYQNIPFPNVDGGAKCVLCQQDLDQEAARRLTRFEDFIKNESKRRETQARDLYQNACKNIQIAALPAACGFRRKPAGDSDLMSATVPI